MGASLEIIRVMVEAFSNAVELKEKDERMTPHIACGSEHDVSPNA
jgi:hypothetical protein